MRTAKQQGPHLLPDNDLNDLAQYAAKKLPRDKTVRARLLALKAHLEICEACRATLELYNSERKNEEKL